MQIKRYFIPENMDRSTLEDCGRAEFVEKLLLFISMIQFCRFRKRTYKNDDFIPLKAHILGAYIRPNDVKRVRAELIERGIMECDWERLYGRKCFGHRYTPEYRGRKLVSIVAEYPKGEPDKTAEGLSGPHAYIRQNLERVTIEPAAADLIPSAEADRQNYRRIAYDLISDEAWFFATDKNTGRVFHNVSNCPTALRPCLRLDGRELVEVDIRNCQPMLLGSLYSDRQSAEAKRYNDIVQRGGFYEFMQEHTGYNRDEAKEKFLSFAFGEVRFAESSKFGQAFSANFPQLRTTMDGVKSGDYRNMSALTQKLEADLVINTVVPMCEREGVPVLTIHDSLMMFPEHAGDVQEMIKSECQRLYKLSPCLKIKAGQGLNRSREKDADYIN